MTLADGDALSLLQRWELDFLASPIPQVEVVAAGPFRAMFDRGSDSPWLNYALPAAPMDGPVEVSQAVAQLRRAFAERRLALRFEFNEELWPALAPALERAGLRVDMRAPLMVCTPGDFRPHTAAGVSVRLLDVAASDTVLSEFQSVQSAGFEEPAGPPSVAEATRLRAELAAGRRQCALADCDGAPAGVACLCPLGGVGELVGVSTLPAFRRRGVASTASSFLVRRHFAAGGTLAWLDASGQPAGKLYGKIGFRLVGARIYMEDQPAPGR